MKAFIPAIAILLFHSASFSQKVKPLEHSPIRADIKTISFEVLDIDFENGFIAFKQKYQIIEKEDEEGNYYQEPCNCNYAGMQDHPLAGVVLGVFNLKANSYQKTFVIYESAETKDKCTKIETSQKKLAEAKEYFKSLNLDITSKPTGKQIENNNFIANTSNKSISFDESHERLDTDEEMNTITHYKIKANDEVAYEEKFEFYAVMGGTGAIKLLEYYQKGSKIVILEKFIHQSGLMGFSYNEFYSFSPIIDLNSL